MKTKSFFPLVFVIIFCFYGFSVLAQNLTITEQKAKTEDLTDVDAWVAHLDQDPSFTEKTLKRFFKDTYNVKSDNPGKAKNIIILEKIKLVEISPLRGDLRANISPEGAGTMISFSFSPGYDIHFMSDTHPDEYAKIQELVKKYIKYHYTAFYKDFVADMEKKIKDKQSDIAKNEKRIAKNQKSIQDNELKINAGDPKSAKLAKNNTDDKTEISNLEAKNATLQNEIEQLQASIATANESLQKVLTFQ